MRRSRPEESTPKSRKNAAASSGLRSCKTSSILAEMIWANYFGRISLGRIRGMGSLITSAFSAGGPPFFGLLFDATQSYSLSFSIFIAMLFASAFLSLFLRAPVK